MNLTLFNGHDGEVQPVPETVRGRVTPYAPQVISVNKPSARRIFATLFTILAVLTEKNAFAQFTISTLASNSPTAIISGTGVAVDTAGSVYANGTVPQVGPAILGLTGAVRPVVGGINRYAPFPGCGQPASNVGMADLAGVAVDGSDAIYVAQSGNGPILRVQTTATCLLGSTYFWATSIATDNAGNAYFAAGVTNQPGYAVYEATPAAPAGAQLTFAGNGSVACTGGALGEPDGLAVDSSGSLYIADSRCNVIWKVSAPGAMPVVVAGNGTAGFSGNGGPATSASLNQPRGIAVDDAGNLFITDWGNHVVRAVSASTHTISTIAGTGEPGLLGDGGPAMGAGAQLQFPWGIAVGSEGTIYFGDQVTPSSPNPNSRVRQLTPDSARMISPAPGSILPSTSVTFDWTGTYGGNLFKLDVRDASGNVYFSGPTTATTQPISNLPCDGRTLYVKLQTFMIDYLWVNPRRYTYTACQALSLSVTPASLPPQGGTVMLTGTAHDAWMQSVQLDVTETIYQRNCIIYPIFCSPPIQISQPISLGTGTLTPGSTQIKTITVQVGALPWGFEQTRVYRATLTAPSGAVLAARSVSLKQY